jgi:hypothetical protein
LRGNLHTSHAFTLPISLITTAHISPFPRTAVTWKEGIFSVSGVPLVKGQEYSQTLASDWSKDRNLLRRWRPISQRTGIFSVSGIISISHWSKDRNIFTLWRPKGHPEGIFSVSGVPSVLLIRPDSAITEVCENTRR